jgi:heterodisulfide reductase subunit C
MAKRVARRLPFKQGLAMGLAALFRPRTRGWGKAGAAISEYVHEQEQRNRKALGIEERT